MTTDGTLSVDLPADALLALITIGVTTYNRQSDIIRLLENLDSLFPEVRVIVIDDGSTDETPSILSSVSDRRVMSIIDGRNEGLIARRNQINAYAKTPYVLSIDDDAVFTSRDTLIAAIDQMEADSRIGVLALPFVNILSGERIFQCAPNTERSWQAESFVGTAHVIRTRDFKDVGGYNESLWRQGEETDLSLRLLAHGRIVALGYGGPIHHFEGKRSLYDIAFYGRRNDITTVYRLWPLPMVPGRILWLVGRAIKHAYRERNIGHIRGAFSGLASIARGRCYRQPVRRATIREYVSILRSGPKLRPLVRREMCRE